MSSGNMGSNSYTYVKETYYLIPLTRRSYPGLIWRPLLVPGKFNLVYPGVRKKICGALVYPERLPESHVENLWNVSTTRSSNPGKPGWVLGKPRTADLHHQSSWVFLHCSLSGKRNCPRFAGCWTTGPQLQGGILYIQHVVYEWWNCIQLFGINSTFEGDKGLGGCESHIHLSSRLHRVLSVHSKFSLVMQDDDILSNYIVAAYKEQ